MSLIVIFLSLAGASDYAWFNILNSFSYPLDFETGFGPFLCWFSLVALSIYFITSSDSGSLIVDHLASNGFEETHWTQRVFWSFTEGSVATALLVAGGGQSLRALQAASILSGLPFALLICLMCFSIYKMCIRAELNDKEGIETSLQEDFKQQKIFSIPIYGGIFNIMERIFSLGHVHCFRQDLMPLPTFNDVMNFLVAIVIPWFPLYQVYRKFSPKASDTRGNVIGSAIYGALHLLWIALIASMRVSRGFRGFAWVVFLFNGCILASFRSK